MADRQPPEAPRWVHVGDAYVYVDESGRLAREPAPSRESASAEKLAQALGDIGDRPDAALAALEEAVARVDATTDSVENLVDLVEGLARADPEVLAKHADPLLRRMVDDYRAGRFRDVVRLARAGLAVYLLIERWRDLVALLHLIRRAAEQLRDAAEASATLSDLGILAEAAGPAPLAGELARQAAEHAPAEAAGQAAQVAVHTGVGAGVKVAAAVAGALLVAGGATGFAVGGGGWYGLGGSDAEVRAGGDAEVVAFAVRSDASEAGTQDERTGWSPPQDAVEPGDELEICEPLYLYAFVAFDGMKAGTEWSVVASNPGRADLTESGTWSSSEPSYTMQLWAERSGQVISYGSWTFVTTIGGDEVDEAEVTLVEAC